MPPRRTWRLASSSWFNAPRSIGPSVDDAFEDTMTAETRPIMRTATLLLTCITALSAGCGRGSHDAAPASTEHAAPVTTSPAAIRASTEIFEAGGVIRGRTSATIASRVMAPVRAVLVRPGDHVRTGQPLVLLDDRDVSAAARQSSAQAVAGERRLEAARAEQDTAAAALALARSTHGRMAALHARKSATDDELDHAVAALRAAEARVAGTTAAAGEARAGLEAAQAGREAADVAAGFARVVAPFDGLVTEKLVDPGNLVAPGTPLVRLEDTRAYELEVRVDESRAAWIARGTPVSVLVDGPGSRIALEGRVFDVARAVDADTRTFLVTIALPAHDALRPGMFGRARTPGPAHRALTIPDGAIVRHGQLTNVFVTEAGRARLRLVSIGRSASGLTEVLAGLSEGEEVVVGPPPSLRDGSPVVARVANASPAAGGRP
jgi:RND family efflux transporter MFP subunit